MVLQDLRDVAAEVDARRHIDVAHPVRVSNPVDVAGFQGLRDAVNIGSIFIVRPLIPGQERQAVGREVVLAANLHAEMAPVHCAQQGVGLVTQRHIEQAVDLDVHMVVDIAAVGGRRKGRHGQQRQQQRSNQANAYQFLFHDLPSFPIQKQRYFRIMIYMFYHTRYPL